MEINPEQLEALLEILKEWQVEEFEGLGFHVRFQPQLPPAPPSAEVLDFPQKKEEGPRSAWQEPKLWPGGKPPSFPK